MNYSNAEQFYEGINIVFDLYTKYGDNDYIGEEVTQLEHAFSVLIKLHIEFPNNMEVILGSFLHDVGHLLSIHDSKWCRR